MFKKYSCLLIKFLGEEVSYKLFNLFLIQQIFWFKKYFIVCIFYILFIIISAIFMNSTLDMCHYQ